MAVSISRSLLVETGSHKDPSSCPQTFLTHTLPEIHDNTIVVAATSPTPERLVEQWGDFLHGSPRRDRKVVLNSELIQSGISPVTIVEPPKMIERFLEEAKKASIRARQNGCPLLLMVFCHGIQGHYLCLNNGSQNKGLSIVRLQAVLDPNIKVALFTTACYSGGSSTPLLASDVGLQATAEADMSLQPEEPTKQQTETYNEFCRAITSSLQLGSEPRIFGEHFHFSAHDDEWEWSWTRRTGIPLAYFEERWNQLETIPRREFPKPGDDNYTGSHLTGSANSYIDDMTRKMAHSRVFGMAELFRQLCPGDWNKGWNVALAGDFFNFLQDRPGAPSAEYIADVIYFRSEHQGPPFAHPHTYTASAIAETYSTKEEALVAVDAYCQYVSNICNLHLECAIESPSVRRSGRTWLKSLGRRIRRSLSPSKSSQSSLARLTISDQDEASSSSKGKKLGKAPGLQQPQRQRLEKDYLEG
ncbi:hypothetical protein B0T25DRAFT_622373 [Lasiosphaeria hispida]|uniref:Uncharacterized protein n=1 Tax=Lasiosphaeria hispida TaxID=260671 RepID=A0AAJ0MGB2_9PEZI|nr:hypothetical protein B0T25DRAFT_622373 [Lasiosphaeria hispida]